MIKNPACDRKISTIDLEFVRPGPPHNQLLSPLTEYLALCGDFQTMSLRVPWEHGQFMRRLQELRYPGGNQDLVRRQGVIEEMAREVAKLLGSVPGLSAAMASNPDEVLTHLNVVASPAELSLLPFELSKVPANCPGDASSWLSLQTVSPVVVTRQVRGVSADGVVWPTRPNILFIASSPRGTIPMKRHVHALLAAVKPWIAPPREGENGTDATTRVSKILTILNNADIHQIQDACAKQPFTHVHILAHGAEDPTAEGRPFGLALRAQDGSDDVDVVSGSRMATALRSLPCGTETPAYPSVVTVASCDSGNRGDVVYSGASFAHELHQAGIPFVVASQFPLSKPGSVHMVEVLYDRLLWGEDPREVLHDLRRKLYALHTSTTHDWASLVVYCALPATLGDQLKDTAYEQAKAAIDAALGACDDLIAEMKGGTTPLGPDQLHHHVDELLRRADAAAERMPTGGEYETEGFGMLASTEKRKAEVQYQLGRALLPATESTETIARVFEASLASLRRAQAHYDTAVQQNLAESSGAIKKKRSLHWVLTQHLSLRMVLGEPLLEDYWMAAKVSAEVDRKLDSRTPRVWAEGSLVELYALLVAYPKSGIMSTSRAKAAALASCRAVLDLAAPGSFELHSTRRQIRRYLDWWCDVEFQKQIGEPRAAPSKPGDSARGNLRALRNTMGALVKMFPEA